MSKAAEIVAMDRERSFELGTENRFPLDLTADSTPTWDAYESSLLEVWDPEDPSWWVGFDPAEYSADDRAAGALVWSQRAWVDYPAIAESEAILVRACLEPGIGAGLKYCLSMRAVERARSADLAYLIAQELGRFTETPSTQGLRDLLDAELVRRVLHAEADFDAYVAAHLLAQATVDLRLWEQSARTANEPLASLIGLVVRDKARMIGVAWEYVATALPGRSETDLVAIAAAVEFVLAEEEFRGRQVPALLADGDDRDQLLAAHASAATAGLGGIAARDQQELFAAAADEVAQRLALLGVHIAVPQGPRT